MWAMQQRVGIGGQTNYQSLFSRCLAESTRISDAYALFAVTQERMLCNRASATETALQDVYNLYQVVYQQGGFW